MLRLAVLCLMTSGSLAQIVRVLGPKSLVNEVRSHDGHQGFLSTSLSTFGEYEFDEDIIIRVVPAPEDNLQGCNPFHRPDSSKPSNGFAFLVQQGGCSFSQKANMAAGGGARMVLVDSGETQEKMLVRVPSADPTSDLTRNPPSDSRPPHFSQRLQVYSGCHSLVG